MNGFCSDLLDFYRKENRILPWRSDPSPYHVWISEIMLQQTRVEAVVGYYLRFIAALPTIQDLAGVAEDKLLKLWEGLGYYSRARNLKKAAILVCTDFGGKLPSDVSALSSLPGVGDYTARAIASLAYGKKEIAVDGNLVRVYSRCFAKPLSLASMADRAFTREKLFDLCQMDPSLFNQALMDIGQRYCIPNGKPKCNECPLKNRCLAFLRGQVPLYPLPKAKKEKKIEKRTIVLLEKETKIYLHKRPATGLLASMYEPLNLLGEWNEKELDAELRKMGFQVEELLPLGAAKHVFTHKIWEMQGYRAAVKGGFDDGFVEKKKIRGSYPVPSAFSAYLG